MKLLISGANGQVGQELVRRARAARHEVEAWGSSDLDISDGAAVERRIDASSGSGSGNIDALINAAAYTAVDQAEKDRRQAYAVNRDGVAFLAAACARNNIPLLHISTDYVFSGEQAAPYKEDDPAAPLGVYGDSKWQGEQALRERWPRHIIVRTSWIFSAQGQNFVKTILRLARERETLRIVADQYGCPTYAGAIADTLLALAAQLAFSRDSAWGTYHYCGSPACSWHEFATRIIALAARYEPLAVRAVAAIETSAYPTPAARPANSVLDCGRIKQAFAIEPEPWRRGLEQVLPQLCNSQLCE